MRQLYYMANYILPMALGFFTFWLLGGEFERGALTGSIFILLLFLGEFTANNIELIKYKGE